MTTDLSELLTEVNKPAFHFCTFDHSELLFLIRESIVQKLHRKISHPSPPPLHRNNGLSLSIRRYCALLLFYIWALQAMQEPIRLLD